MDTVDNSAFLEPETRSGFYVSGDTKRAWKVMLDMLQIFSDICERHQLRWFMIAGSLLGAIRHHGFIPWDDDIDVAMPRDDYEKFLSIAQKELPRCYFLQTSLTDRYFACGFAKIRDSRTAAYEDANIKFGLRYNQGIFIDVFPLDGCPKNAADRIENCKALASIRDFHYRVAFNVYTYGRQALKSVCLKMVWILIGKTIVSRRNSLAKKYVYEECDHVVISPSEWEYAERFRFDRRWFDEFEKVKFEYLDVRVPKGYDAMLQCSYGDWRKPVRGCSTHGSLRFDCDHAYSAVLPHFNTKDSRYYLWPFFKKLLKRKLLSHKFMYA